MDFILIAGLWLDGTAWTGVAAELERLGHRAIRRVVLIGGFPNDDGAAYADFFEPVNGAMPFPGWDAFEGPDSADLDDATRYRIAANAIPVPETVTKATVRLGDERRFDVPVTVVCPEFGRDEAEAWIGSGGVPELAAAHDVSFIDIDTGHWPMFTRPAELARLLDKTARER